MIELPRGLWKWMSENARDLARIAAAAEAIAEELGEIRRTLHEDKRREQD